MKKRNKISQSENIQKYPKYPKYPCFRYLNDLE